METTVLIARIEAAAAALDREPTTIVKRAVGNWRLYRRLKEGGGCNIKTAAKLTEYLDGLQAGGAQQ